MVRPFLGHGAPLRQARRRAFPDDRQVQGKTRVRSIGVRVRSHRKAPVLVVQVCRRTAARQEGCSAAGHLLLFIAAVVLLAFMALAGIYLLWLLALPILFVWDLLIGFVQGVRDA